MKKNILNIILIVFLTSFFYGCSTQKNTGTSRFYHDLTTRFNIFFNGSESYKEGIQSINKASKDNYSQVLYMYPSSQHESLTSATSNMDRSIEKCRKAIKLHSIKKKPNKNFKKWNNPKYRAWFDQDEFNPALKDAWLTLAKSEFHKGDFLGSVGTFSYITNHYTTVPEVVAEAQIWTARAYAEMGWIYEAEDVLTKLSTQKLNKKNTGLFSAAMADVLLKKKQYKEAIPYLKLAEEREKDDYLKARFRFILAQLFAQLNDKKQAADYYSQVIKSSPPYEMEFNARVNKAQLLTDGKVNDIEKELKKMAKSRKNKEYLDQVYNALGNIFLQNKDTSKAIGYYTMAVEKSKRNGIEKGTAYIQLGDLYYEKKKYVKAEPNYNEASKLISKDYFDYARVTKRAEVLSNLAKEDAVVVLQDSLQQLANLSEKDRLAVINKIIEDLKKEEKEAQKKLEEQNNPNFNPNTEDDDFVIPNQMIGNNSGNNWYFYNTNTVKSGKTDFSKKWGNRKLEDDWQRSNKSASLFADNNSLNVDSASNNAQGNAGDSIKKNSQKQSDNKTVDYYLQQIPFSAKQKEISNQQIANALFNMGFIFKDKMEDYPMAIETFETFEERFPTDDRVMETIYQRFLIAAKQGNSELEEKYRTQLLARFPGSNYAQMIKEPNFVKRMEKMYGEQDSIYNATYAAYTKSDFNTVFANTEYVKKKYPVSTLLPKFEFLNTLSIGKTQKSNLFKTSLDSLVAHYPQSDVSAMAKDILALMKQGNVAQLGKTHGSLLEKRAEEAATEESENINSLSEDKDGKHRLMFVGNFNDSTLNKLLYQIAMFNFSRFMIKDFDMETGKINAQNNSVSVTNLESYDEVLWYQKTLLSDNLLRHLIDSIHLKLIPISDDNYGKLKTLFTLEQYLDFQKEKLSKDIPKNLTAEAKPIVKTQNEKPSEINKDTKSAEQTKNAENKTGATKPVTAQEVKPTEQKPTEIKTEQKGTTEASKTTSTTEQTAKVDAKQVEPEKPKVEEPQAWFKNTYAYRPNAPHFVVLYIPSGGVTGFEPIQQAFDKYNSANYGMLNLKISLENFGKQQAIIVGTFVDAATAKSYLLRMLKEPAIVNATKNLNKRNLIGTQENLNIMVQKNDLNTYFEFMKEFYLK